MGKKTVVFMSLLIGTLISLISCGGGSNSAPQNPPASINGTLDHSFGDDVNPADGIPDGFIVHDPTAGDNLNDSGHSITIDKTGSIYVTGESQTTTFLDMVLWRYTSNGVLDTTFGGDVNPVDGIPDGFVVHAGAAGGIGADTGRSITIDALGRIYVSGRSDNAAGNSDMIIWRYTSVGVLDTTFGGDVNPADGIPDGFVVHDGANGAGSFDHGNSIILSSFGKIYVVGTSYDSNFQNPVMVLWCYTNDGVLDTFFGSDINPTDGIPDGFIVVGGSGEVSGHSITIDSMGRIYVSGHSYNAISNYDMVIWRYTSAGVLDTTFGGDVNPADGTPDGFVAHNNAAGGNNLDYGGDITIDTTGNIYVAGASYNATGNIDMVIWRYTSAGVLDTTFGGDVNPANGIPDGFVVHDNAAGGSGNDRGYSMTLDSSGRIYVAGISHNTSGDLDMVVWRYTSTGVLDTSFGSGNGLVTHNNAAGGSGYDFGYSIVLAADDQIFVTGKSYKGAGDTDMAIWCYK